VIHEICTPAFVGRRQQHKNFEASCSMEFNPQADHEEAGMVLLSDDRFNYVFVLGMKDGKPVVRLAKTEGGKYELIAEALVEETESIVLILRGSDTLYDFYCRTLKGDEIKIGDSQKTSLLSSTVNEGFTGTYIGMYVSSNKQQSDNYADFDWFEYKELT